MRIFTVIIVNVAKCKVTVGIFKTHTDHEKKCQNNLTRSCERRCNNA